MSQNQKHKFKYFLPPILWAGVIFLFSSLPSHISATFSLTDFIIKKSAHMTEYGIFAAFVYRALKANGMKPKKAAFAAIFVSALYGMTDEFHQRFTPGRGSHGTDVGFDTIGATIAIYVIWNLLPKAPTKLRTLAKDLELL